MDGLETRLLLAPLLLYSKTVFSNITLYFCTSLHLFLLVSQPGMTSFLIPSCLSYLSFKAKLKSQLSKTFSDPTSVSLHRTNLLPRCICLFCGTYYIVSFCMTPCQLCIYKSVFHSRLHQPCVIYPHIPRPQNSA